MKYFLMNNINNFFILKLLKKFVKNILHRYNLRTYRAVNEDKILKLISNLKPHNLGHKLIRVGGNTDGSYLIPDLLSEINFCFSPGVGKISEFELELKSKGIKSFLADYSVDGPGADNLFNFQKKYIKSYESDNSITFDKWIESSVKEEEKNFLVQMDIEGSEYEVINSASEKNLKRIKILIIEFHHLEFLSNEIFFENFQSTLKKIANYFEICHIHPNNCCGISKVKNVIFPNVLEITFLNKDFVKTKDKVNKLPHELDIKNVANKEDIILPDYWYI